VHGFYVAADVAVVSEDYNFVSEAAVTNDELREQLRRVLTSKEVLALSSCDCLELFVSVCMFVAFVQGSRRQVDCKAPPVADTPWASWMRAAGDRLCASKTPLRPLLDDC